jgi:esterase/lipase superfamily enzyme
MNYINESVLDLIQEKTHLYRRIPGIHRPCFLLLVAVLLLAGCASTVTLMPTPEALRDEHFDVFAHNPSLEKSNKISIFYATNRLPSEDDSGLIYTKRFDHALRFGEAILQIGSDDTTWHELYAQSTTGERKDTFDISLIKTEEIGHLEEPESPEQLTGNLAEFMAKLNDAILKSPLQTLTIYVHGANSSFYRASAQGAQYRYFTGSQAVVLLFAWPSAENILKYATDVKNTKQTAPDFIRLLKLMAAYSDAKRINIIAYSAGGRLSGDALGRMGREYEKADAGLLREKFRFGQLYFTSSDENLYELIDNLPSYIRLFEGVTITADKKDGVLGFAKITDGQPRLGRPPEDADSLKVSEAQNEWLNQAINGDQLNVINLEINKISGFKFSHGAWYENPWVSTDVIVTLNLGLKPKHRGLDKYKGYRNRDVWYFPPDYLERLKSSLLDRRK